MKVCNYTYSNYLHGILQFTHACIIFIGVCVHAYMCMHACILVVYFLIVFSHWKVFIISELLKKNKISARKWIRCQACSWIKNYYSYQVIVDKRQVSNFRDIGTIMDKFSRHHNAHAWLRYKYVNNKIIIIIILYMTLLLLLLISLLLYHHWLCYNVFCTIKDILTFII